MAGLMEWPDGCVWRAAWDSVRMFAIHFVYYLVLREEMETIREETTKIDDRKVGDSRVKMIVLEAYDVEWRSEVLVQGFYQLLLFYTLTDVRGREKGKHVK